MSELIVKVSEIDGVESHPDAERLDIFTIRGWKIIANKKDDGNGNLIPRYSVGDKVVYCPPDSVLPLALADKYGFTSYLTPVKDENGNQIGGKVRAIRLRGYPSYGCMFEAEIEDPVGLDVAEKYGITKWEPPAECKDGDAERPDAAFHKYTDIENIGNYPNLFKEGEEVVFSEKLHGQNARWGKIAQVDENGNKKYVFAAGSHGVRRREFDQNGSKSRFWEPLTDKMKNLIDHLCNNEKNVIVFGEIYGAGIQDMNYGLVNGISFAAFDIAVDGRYLDVDIKIDLFSKFEINMVPFLYRGPFSIAEVEKYTSGNTTVCDPSKAGKFKGREGIVISPVIERYGEGRSHQQRAILKSISVDYLSRKNATDSH